MSEVLKKSIQLRTGLFSSRSLEYTVRFSTRARKARIKVDLQGIEVVLPDKVPGEYADKMMRDYSEWVLKKTALFEELKKRQELRPTNSDNTLLFHGEKIKIMRESPSLFTRGHAVRIEANRIYLPLNGYSKAEAARLVQKYLKERAREEINKTAEAFSRKMGTPFVKITIRDQRTRWGACSARKTLSFNWRLIMAPPEVAEYVVIHELAHLIEMNHSIRFWKTVEKFCPDYKKRRLWLKKNGHLLRPDFTSLV